MLVNYPSFWRSQPGQETERPLAHTGSPWHLFISDVNLFFSNILYIPLIFLPLYPWPSGSLDELYPSWENLFDITLHCILFVLQLTFLVTLPLLIFNPVSVYLVYISAVLCLNALICWHFNRSIPEDGLPSTEDEYSRQWTAHDDEYWIFLNGICVGKHWLQNNIDRLSRTFHRPVVGVHNKTYGVVFDLVQCLIQRALLYATSDIRDCYVLVKKALYRPGVKRVVLILHSQGGIEGGMILDWLLDEIPQDLLQILEVYTFGCLANHFSNPSRSRVSSATAASESKRTAPQATNPRAISHIEHYANAYDFASRWGVLNFTGIDPKKHLENRFMGKVFVNPRAGHQLNQHYLDSIFPLDQTGRFTREPIAGDFMQMDSSAETPDRYAGQEQPESCLAHSSQTGELETASNSILQRNDVEQSVLGSAAMDGSSNGVRNNGTVQMGQISRLWKYRNGGRP
ncbi:hypothetical protein GGI42DRAFT_319436 [Trichoderma sp. SZMC 28013]